MSIISENYPVILLQIYQRLKFWILETVKLKAHCCEKWVYNICAQGLQAHEIVKEH
jgi:hypothetical protein